MLFLGNFNQQESGAYLFWPQSMYSYSWPRPSNWKSMWYLKSRSCWRADVRMTRRQYEHIGKTVYICQSLTYLHQQLNSTTIAKWFYACYCKGLPRTLKPVDATRWCGHWFKSHSSQFLRTILWGRFSKTRIFPVNSSSNFRAKKD